LPVPGGPEISTTEPNWSSAAIFCSAAISLALAVKSAAPRGSSQNPDTHGARRSRAAPAAAKTASRSGGATPSASTRDRSVRRCGARVRPRSMSLIARALTPEVSATSSSVMPAARRWRRSSVLSGTSSGIPP
jgi:hypothetical protein